MTTLLFSRVVANTATTSATSTTSAIRKLSTIRRTIVIADTNGANGTVHLIQSQPSQTPFNPPLVMLAGTGQSCESYNTHVRGLSEKLKRPVYCIDLRGQGKTTLNLNDVSLKAQVKDLPAILNALDIHGPVDLSGFSFGGRVALSFAAIRPDLVHRLVLTGVPASRDAVGRTILRSWRAVLAAGDLTAMSWVAMATSHSPWFLQRYESNLEEWAKNMAKNSDINGVRAILEQSHSDLPTDEFHALNLAQRVQCPTLVIGGADDRIATAFEVERLAQGRAWSVAIVSDAAHMVPIEQPAIWRSHVVDFLSPN